MTPSPKKSAFKPAELLQYRSVQIALGVVAVIAAGALAYYLIESIPPKLSYAAVTTGNITQDITATGVVSPIQNPTLSFEQSGQVRTVNAVTGQKVSAGTLLASLDTSVLSASLAAAQATLDGLEAGPRSVDVASQQTAVQTAQTTLSNAYANYPETLQNTFSQDQGAITSNVN